MKLHNKPSMKSVRQRLRAALTPAEARLWSALRNNQLAGRKFRRQHSVGPYVLDFYCPQERLAVELDGAAHDHEDAFEHDETRRRHLETLHIKVVRFENRDVIENLEGVLQVIRGNFRNGS